MCVVIFPFKENFFPQSWQSNGFFPECVNKCFFNSIDLLKEDRQLSQEKGLSLKCRL